MFKLPKEVKDSIKEYKRSLAELEQGKTSPARFRGIRVPWGIYSHRGGKVYMTRIRIPAGVVSPSQLEALARVSRELGDGMLHVTTRQDIQIHNVSIENTAKVLDHLQEYDLSPRGGGGNTVRNIMACSLSGVCREELFDVRQYAISLTERLLQQDTSFVLPRKFKIAFSGCGRDCAGCLLNDVGFLAELREGKQGFKVFVGGGMGAKSRIGKLLHEFISPQDLGPCTEAVKNTFYKTGDRRNKHHNRLRFLIEDLGLDQFKRLYEEEFERLKEPEYVALRRIDVPEREGAEEEIPQVADEEYGKFLEYNVSPQKQKGFASVRLRIPRGDISADEVLALAGLQKDFPEIEFRTSLNQNLILCGVRNRGLYELFSRLKNILKGFLYPQTLLDVVACKGASTCNLGLCNSPGLAKEIENLVEKEFLGSKLLKLLQIRMNGCPNACGHHPIGAVSFCGIVRRVDDRPIPSYKVLLGGRREGELTTLAEEVGIIPAKNIPDFLRAFWRRLEAGVDDTRDIYQLLAGWARGLGKEILQDYSHVPSYSKGKEFYFDWGKSEEFSLAGLGPGECGAGVLEIIEADLAEAKAALEEAAQNSYAAEELKKALFLSARALLVVRGKDPQNAKEALSNFKEEFVDKGVASQVYADIEGVFDEISAGLEPEAREERFSYGKRFLEHINQLYNSMDSAFHFPRQEGSAPAAEVSGGTFDLRGTPCPLNYVKAKLKLENLKGGDVLELLLDEGEPIINVPKSLKDDGHEILRIQEKGKFYVVVVKKG